MTRLPLLLRLFWLGYAGALLAALLLLGAGPAIEARWFAVWNGLSVQDRARDARFVRFALVATKMRLVASPGVDVTMTVPGDAFDLTLYVDKSAPGEPACTHRIPWSHGQAVALGPHRIPFCVEIPENVASSTPIGLAVVPRYRGFAGLWEVRMPLPMPREAL